MNNIWLTRLFNFFFFITFNSPLLSFFHTIYYLNPWVNPILKALVILRREHCSVLHQSTYFYQILPCCPLQPAVARRATRTVPSAPFQRKLELVQGGPLPQHFLTPFGSLVSLGMGDLPPSPTPRQPRMESSDESLGYPGFRVSKIEYTAPDLEARLLPLGQNRLISLGMLTEASILPKGTKEFGIFPGWSNQTCFAIFYSFLPLGHHSYGELELLYLLWPTVPSVKWR